MARKSPEHLGPLNTGPWGDRTAHLRRRAIRATRWSIGVGFAAVLLSLVAEFHSAVGVMGVSLGLASVATLTVDELRARRGARIAAVSWLDAAALGAMAAFVYFAVA